MASDTVPVLHPARFSDAVLDRIGTMLDEYQVNGVVLDPFAGAGKIHRLATPTRRTVGVEIEPEWAATHPGTIVGNALALGFGAESIDAVVTSPCYGNRLADHHEARDGSTRRSYTHDL